MKKVCLRAAKIVHRISEIFAWISAATLFFMAAVSFVDVVGRYFFRSPFPGAQEIVEVSMSLFVYTGLAQCIRLRRCITVPVLVERTSAAMQQLITAIGNVLCLIMSCLLIWQLAISTGNQLARMYVGTPVLKIPYAPFYVVVLIGYCAVALELLILVVTDLQGFAGARNMQEGEGAEPCK